MQSARFETMRRATRLTLAGLALTATSACALIDPHVTGDPTLRDQALYGQTGLEFYGNLPAAIKYADNLRLRYDDAARQHSIARNVTALAVIPLTATALYLGVVQNVNVATTGPLAFAAAGTLALGSYFTSKPAQRIYFGASQQIGCTIVRARPFLLSKGEYGSFDTALNDLTSFLAAQTGQSDDLRKLRETEVAGMRFRAQVNLAPSSLVATVDGIRNEVDRKLVEAEPDLDSLPRVFAAIGTNMQGLTRAPSTPETKAEPVRGFLAARSIEIDRLEKAKRDAAIVSQAVNQAKALADELERLPICVPRGVVPMTLSPSDSPIRVKQGATAQVKVTGGAGVPQASFVGTVPDVTKLTLESTVQGGAVVIVLKATANASGTKASVSVTDGPGEQKRTFDVEVTKD